MQIFLAVVVMVISSSLVIFTFWHRDGFIAVVKHASVLLINVFVLGSMPILTAFFPGIERKVIPIILVSVLVLNLIYAIILVYLKKRNQAL